MKHVLPAVATALLLCASAFAGDAWRTDRAWYDGLAEKCTYQATRTIYGAPRSYTAIAYTNKENVDPKTTCKSEDDRGVESFKHHWSERVPTERYDYDFSTMSYVEVDGMRPFKLQAATQEDCGASFKELVRDGKRYRWLDSVYFPGGGIREGRCDGDAIPFDALTVWLRDFDFEAKKDVAVSVLPMQKDTHRVPFEPVARTVRFVGTSDVSVPFGKVRAHELALVDPAGTTEARYWFAADAAAPLLHVLVKFSGPQGIAYELATHERTAYWKR